MPGRNPTAAAVGGEGVRITHLKRLDSFLPAALYLHSHPRVQGNRTSQSVRIHCGTFSTPSRHTVYQPSPGRPTHRIPNASSTLPSVANAKSRRKGSHLSWPTGSDTKRVLQSSWQIQGLAASNRNLRPITTKLEWSSSGDHASFDGVAATSFGLAFGPSPLEGFKALLIAESPLAFRRRLIFTEAEPFTPSHNVLGKSAP